METTTTTNGKLRKSLAEQIDRLDGILDGLSAALNESVAAAVKDAVGLAVREAIQAVMTEVFANPAVLEMLSGATSQPSPSRQRLTSRLSGWVARVGHRMGAGLRATAGRCAAGVHAAGKALGSCWARVRLLRRIRLQLLTALGVGMLAAVAAYHAGPWLASTATGAGSFAAALAVQLWVGVRRLLAGPFLGSS
jgi:hypothetical protein